MPRNNFYEEDTQEKKRYYKDDCPVCSERQFYKEQPKKKRVEEDYYPEYPEKCYCPPCPDWLMCPPPWYWGKPEEEKKECRKEKCERRDECERKEEICEKKCEEKSCDIEAYGYVYSLTSTAVTVATNSDVLFTNNGPVDCVVHTPNTAQIFIRKSGNYEVFYSIFTTLGAGATISLAVNGAVNPSTTLIVPVAVGDVTGKVILPLRAGDFLTLRNSSTVTLTLSVAPALGAQLTLERLDDIDCYAFV